MFVSSSEKPRGETPAPLAPNQTPFDSVPSCLAPAQSTASFRCQGYMNCVHTRPKHGPATPTPLSGEPSPNSMERRPGACTARAERANKRAQNSLSPLEMGQELCVARLVSLDGRLCNAHALEAQSADAACHPLYDLLVDLHVSTKYNQYNC